MVAEGGGIAMMRRQWTSKQKAAIVLQGLKGTPVSQLCVQHQISQGQYYQWRDQFLSSIHKVFELRDQTQRETRLMQENTYLKAIVGELNMELKKLDEVFE
jgi:transposase-like protein